MGDIADLANRPIDTLEGVDESTGSRLLTALGVKPRGSRLDRLYTSGESSGGGNSNDGNSSGGA